jgi:hypothetical protein
MAPDDDIPAVRSILKLMEATGASRRRDRSSPGSLR